MLGYHETFLVVYWLLLWWWAELTWTWLWCSYLVAALTKGGCHTFFCIVVLKRRRSHPWGALINTWLLYAKDHALLPCEGFQNKELLRSHWILVDSTRDQIHDLILIATTFAKHHTSFRSRKRQNFRRFLGATELKFSLGCVFGIQYIWVFVWET